MSIYCVDGILFVDNDTSYIDTGVIADVSKPIPKSMPTYPGEILSVEIDGKVVFP